MRKTGFSLLTLAVILFSFQSSFAGDMKKETASLLEKLKTGGYVIYMRHPHTDKSTKDTDKKNLKNCATQRNLSEKGKEVAKKIGTAVKALKVSFETVQTSEFCRAREVPALMGLEKSETTASLNHSGGLAKEEAAKRAEFLKKAFASKPKSNLLLIGHSPNIRDVSLDLISEGFKPADMLVIKAKEGEPGYELVGRVTPKNWLEWTTPSAETTSSVKK
ncbi:MAG: hypothetical protein ACRBBN_05115 [Methyloligellaceae bacterium]